MKKLTLLTGLTSIFLCFNAVSKDNNNNFHGVQPFHLAPNVTAKDYMDKTIILKVKAQYRTSCNAEGIAIAPLNTALLELKSVKVYKSFPHAEIPKRKYNELNQEFADLTLIYQVKYEAEVGIEEAVNKILKTGIVEYAQPNYIYQHCYSPNDYVAATQYHIAKIKANLAWDIQKGDTNVVIGIVDSGTDINHPDLITNFKHNYLDLGTDADGDGYLNNFTGWDLGGADYALNPLAGDNDPDIKGSNNDHGAHVSGDASASTDNGKGITGVGFNCKLLPVKCSADNDTRGSGGAGYVIAGYEGIVYAADHGAQIINCSWGGSGGGPQGQDVINYATINKNAIVICAAGNDNVDTEHFPSAYNYAISVASSTSGDKKSSFSNFGYTIDVTAPGSGIYSTTYNNTYGSMDGTSMASPVAAGACGLIKSHYPNYNGLQVGERLRVTADNINSLNTGYTNKLGSGRINVMRACTTKTPSIRSQNLTFSDGNDETFIAGDTLKLSGSFVNYLDSTSTAAKVTLTAQAGGLYVTFLAATSNFTLGQLAPLQSTNNLLAPFKVIIKATAPANQLITFKLTYTDGSYSSVEYVNLIVNVDYINVTVNKLHTSITSKGLLGYNTFGQLNGIGMTYNDSALLYEGGFMVGIPGKTMDGLRNVDASNADVDFKSLSAVRKLSPVVSDFDLEGKFNDAGAASRINVQVNHKEYAWASAPNDKFIIVRHTIINKGTTTLNQLYAGVLADFDIQQYQYNKSDEMADIKLGYCYNTTNSGLYVGMKILNSIPFVHHATDNVSPVPADDTIDVQNLRDVSKYWLMVTPRAKSGGTGAGNDVMSTVSSGPFSIVANDSIQVDFAYVVGEDSMDIRNVSVQAQTKYDEVFGPNGMSAKPMLKNNIELIYPNPARNTTNISINSNADSKGTIEVLNISGQLVLQKEIDLTIGKNNLSLDVSDLSTGNYILKLISNESTSIQKLSIIK